MNIAQTIDHTLLKATATEAQIKEAKNKIKLKLDKDERIISEKTLNFFMFTAFNTIKNVISTKIIPMAKVESFGRRMCSTSSKRSQGRRSIWRRIFGC